MSPFDRIPPCNDCRSPRVEVTIDQVPEKHRLGVDKMASDLRAAGMKVRQIVHCKKCDQYASFSDWSAF